MSLSKKELYVIGAVVVLLVLAILAYLNYLNDSTLQKIEVLASPSPNHWLGTDLSGSDVLINLLRATFLELVTVIILLPCIYIGGAVFGVLISYYHSTFIREVLLGIFHYIITIPIILVGIFLLIFFGTGQKNLILVLIIAYIPTQVLYVFNQMETVKKKDFVLSKMSFGFTKKYIYRSHLYPNVKSAYVSYTLSRVPEIIMMNMALNFFGLGAQPPLASFGRILYDGLSFMFSAWWLWGFAVVFIIGLFVVINTFTRKLTYDDFETLF